MECGSPFRFMMYVFCPCTSLSILTSLHLAVYEDDSLKDKNHGNSTLLYANEIILQIGHLIFGLLKDKGPYLKYCLICM